MRIIFVMVFLLLGFTNTAFAQAYRAFNLYDSSYTNYGNYSFKILERYRDSIGSSISYYRNYYDILSYNRLSSSFNDGTITGGIIWSNNSGELRRSTTIPYSMITGVPNPTYNYNVSRVLTSTSFTPSSTKTYKVRYDVSIMCSSTLTGASNGKVELQYYNGSSWITVDETSNSLSGLVATNTQTSSLAGEFLANTQLRLVTTTTGTGITTITYIRGSEYLY